MTIYCVLCKKEPIPGDKSRSFHKFPDDDLLKQKWMAFVGISCVTKYTKLCSDHFDDSDYAGTNGYASKRYLLKTAIPSKSVCKFRSDRLSSRGDQFNSQRKQTANTFGVRRTANLLSSNYDEMPINISSTFNRNQQKYGKPLNSQKYDSPVGVNLETNSNFLESYSVNSLRNNILTNLRRSFPLSDVSDVSPNKRMRVPNEPESTVTKRLFREPQSTKNHINRKRNLVTGTCYGDFDDSPTKKFCSSNAIASSPPKNVQNKSETNVSHTSMKRNSSPIDVSYIPPTKKFCFFDGSQPTYMSRKDFSSDEAWTRFLKYTVYKKRQADSSRKKNQRNRKKIGNIKELVSQLRKKNATAAADYLQVI